MLYVSGKESSDDIHAHIRYTSKLGHLFLAMIRF